MVGIAPAVTASASCCCSSCCSAVSTVVKSVTPFWYCSEGEVERALRPRAPPRSGTSPAPAACGSRPARSRPPAAPRARCSGSWCRRCLERRVLRAHGVLDPPVVQEVPDEGRAEAVGAAAALEDVGRGRTVASCWRRSRTCRSARRPGRDRPSARRSAHSAPRPSPRPARMSGRRRSRSAGMPIADLRRCAAGCPWTGRAGRRAAPAAGRSASRSQFLVCSICCSSWGSWPWSRPGWSSPARRRARRWCRRESARSRSAAPPPAP